MVLATCTLGIAVLVLASWIFDFERFKAVIPGEAAMKFNTAMGLLLLAVSQLLLLSRRRSRASTFAGTVAAAAATALGAVTMSQDLFGWDAGLDNLFLREPPAPVGTIHPGRMAPTAGLSLALLGAACVALHLRWRRRHAIDAMSLVALAVAVLALLGYFYDARQLFAFELYTNIAIHTAAAIALLALAALLFDVEDGLFAPVADDSSAGVLMRTLVPAALLIPSVLGAFRLAGENLNWYSTETGTALMAIGNIIGFAVVIGLSVKRLGASERERLGAVRQQVALAAEQEARHRVISTIVHDLRTPLASARLGVDMLSRRREGSTLDLSRLARVGESLGRMEHMLADLLDASRLETGRPLALNRGPCDLAAIATAVVEDLGTLHGPRFVVHAAEGAVGIWDCAALRRVVENLCQNAIKYGAEDRPVTVEVVADLDTATVAVHNEGPPIPSLEQELIFQPFCRGAAREGEAVGWGIGLFLVKSVAEAHGGRVVVESTPERGTTFRVTLPKRWPFGGGRTRPGPRAGSLRTSEAINASP